MPTTKKATTEKPKRSGVIKTIPITKFDRKLGKEVTKHYVPVNERIRLFKEEDPKGRIITDMLEVSADHVIFKATIQNSLGETIATGHARELTSSNMINATNAVENCETSAVGRALANAGIAIEDSVASAEEMQGFITKQESFSGQKQPRQNVQGQPLSADPLAALKSMGQ